MPLGPGAKPNPEDKPKPTPKVVEVKPAARPKGGADDE